MNFFAGILQGKKNYFVEHLLVIASAFLPSQSIFLSSLKS